MEKYKCERNSSTEISHPQIGDGNKIIVADHEILLFLYPKYADFQIGHTLFFLREIGAATITTVSVDGGQVESLGGLIINPDLKLSEINVQEYDLVLLPGGDGIHEVVNHTSLHTLLKEFYANEILIASICGSATFLAKADILRDKKFTCNTITYEHFENVFSGAKYTGSAIEIDNQIITAKGTAFADFTIAIGNQLGLWRNKEQVEHVHAFCKGVI